MAREGVTYEQVKAAAEALVSKQVVPSIRAVRAELGDTGSPNTILRHLSTWRDARPEAPTASSDLPQAILKGINAEMLRVAAEARAEGAAQLALAKAEAADLASAGETLEAERDGLIEQLAGLTSARDVLAGKADEQGAEIQRLNKELDRERQAAEEARIQVAQSRLQIDASVQQLADMRTAVERVEQDLRTERQGRVEAERELAGAKADRTSLNERLTETRLRAEQQADAARIASNEAARLQEALTNVTAERAGLAELVDDLRDRADRQAEAARISSNEAARFQEAASQETRRADELRSELTKALAVIKANEAEIARQGGQRDDGTPGQRQGVSTSSPGPATARPAKAVRAPTVKKGGEADKS